MGFLLTESIRQVQTDHVDALTRIIPPEVLAVGVFQGTPIEQVRATVEGSRLTAVQLHGSSYRAADFSVLRDLPVTLIRAASFDPTAPAEVGDYGEDHLILDSKQGGSGQTWDWSPLLDLGPSGAWLLAGGLHPENVAEAVSALRPWGVDVSSGVESTRGVKDPGRIRDFLSAARGATC